MTFTSPEPWRRTLTIIWVAQFIAMVGMSLVVPFLPFYIQTLGVTSHEEVARWSGYVYAGPFFISFFLTPIWGHYGDRYGRRFMVIRAIFGLALSQALIGLSQSVEMLFVFRMLQGALSGFIAAALALVSSATPREHSGYAMGMLQTATSSGTVIGPLIGGSLADAIGYRPLFFVVAGVCAVAGILIIRYVEEPPRTGTAEQRTSTITDNVRSAFTSDTIRSGVTLIFLSQLALLIVQPIFALYVDSLEPGNTHTATLTGAIFSTTGVFMVISSPWWGKRNDASSYRKNLTVALTGAALSCLVQGFACHAYDLIGLRALQGFCMGGILPSLYSYVSKHAPSARRGGIMGIASSAHVLASMIGPTAGGMIAALTDLRTPFFVAGGLLLCSLLFLRLALIDSQGRADHETGPQKPPLESDPTPIQTDS